MEKRQKRAKLAQRLKEIHEAAEKENRALSAEEEKNWNECNAEIDRLGKEIEREERMSGLAGVLGKPINDADPDPVDKKEDREGAEAKQAKEKRMAAFRHFLVQGDAKEYRALQAGSNVAGGYLIPPEEFANELITTVDNETFIRKLARKMRISKVASLGIPTRAARASDAEWTSELTVGAKDTALTFGKRVMVPHKLSKEILVSDELLMNSPLSPEQIVIDEFKYVFGITEENAFLNGSGAQQPLGVFTASADGIDTDRDVSTGNTTTDIEVDGLISALYTLKGQYQNRAAWIFHRDAVARIRKKKDGNGQYLWQASVQAGEPDKILNRPFYMSEYAPNTFTTGQYVGLLGVWDELYRIVDCMELRLKRLVELYAESAQVAFIADLYVDGAPVKPEAAVRVKLA